jgi:hypothetical protein
LYYFIFTSVSGPRRKHLDSLKSRVNLPKIARTVIKVTNGIARLLGVCKLIRIGRPVGYTKKTTRLAFVRR